MPGRTVAIGFMGGVISLLVKMTPLFVQDTLRRNQARSIPNPPYVLEQHFLAAVGIEFRIACSG